MEEDVLQQHREELLRRRQLRGNLIEWAKYYGKDRDWSPAKHHRVLLKVLQQVTDGELIHSKTGKPCRNVMVLMPPGSAKALSLDTPIPTPSGWKRMGELRAGDQVFDEKGQPCNVTRVSEIWRDRPTYTVVTDCGDYIVADADHEWLVRACGKRPVFKLKKTSTLCRQRSKRVMVQRAKGLDLYPVKLAIDPYLLGLWLGDGNGNTPAITASLEDQKFYKTELQNLGYKTSDRNPNTIFGVLGVRKLFTDLGLLNDPFHNAYGQKHIPSIYLRASSYQRLSLLQGLIDSDGTVCEKRGCTTFGNTNLRLALQVRELVRSLGVKAGWSESRARVNGKDCGPSYKVSFYLKDSARLPRKRKLTKNQQRTPNTYLEVFPSANCDTVCITVDSPSHLFLCGRSMTPTHNSSYTSVIFPIWFMQRRKNCRILACSHSADLIESFSRECRNGVTAHHKVLGYNLLPDSRAVQEWSTTNSGSYRCAGVGAGLAGRRADAGVIDDYIGSQEDADSKLIRDKQWGWYWNDFWPRLKPNAIQVIVANRRHEDDLVGRLIEKEPQKWEEIILPFFAEAGDRLKRKPGEHLWPQWFTDEMAEDVRQLPARTQAGLYQQKPAPEEGSFFKQDMIQTYSPKEYDALMKEEPKVYAAGDWAVSEAKDANRSCFGGAALGSDGLLYILPDIFWKVAGPREVVNAYISFLKRRDPLMFWSEKGHISKSWGPFLREKMLEEGVHNYITEVSPVRDKETRAQSIRARMSMGRVRFPSFATWWSSALHEMLTFPGGKSDDFVDFIAHLGMGLNKMGKTQAPKVNMAMEKSWKPTMKWLRKEEKMQKSHLAGRYGDR